MNNLFEIKDDKTKQKKNTLFKMNKLEILVCKYMVVKIRTHQIDDLKKQTKVTGGLVMCKTKKTFHILISNGEAAI